MKRFLHLMIALFLLAMPVVSAAVSTQPAAAAPVYTCFPSCSTTDGRFLALAGSGLNTLAGDLIKFSIGVTASTASFEIGIFDGDTGGLWDYGTVPSTYVLYADPNDDGSGSGGVVATLPYASMLDNAWATFTIPNSPLALAPSGNYFYSLVVTNSNYSLPSENSFKIRANASIELLPQAFSYLGTMWTLKEAAIIYPNSNITTTPPNIVLTPTTYDGNWNFYLYETAAASSFALWDGDLDYGSSDCSAQHTVNASTAAFGPNYIPPWAAGTAAVPANVVVSALKCPDPSKGYVTGTPPDDGTLSLTGRPPMVNYTVTVPDGTTYTNTDPSGNLQWQQFLVSSDSSVPAEGYHTGSLPAGTYVVSLKGMDLQNLNAWRFFAPVLGVCDTGIPCVPVPPHDTCTATATAKLTGNTITVKPNQYLWFNMEFKPAVKPNVLITYYVTNVKISFTDSVTHAVTNVTAPNSTITLNDSSVSVPTINFTGGQWVIQVPAAYSGSDQIFMDGYAWQNTGTVSVKPNNYSITATVKTSMNGTANNISWRFAVALYNNTFMSGGYNGLGVQVTHIAGGDNAGTPESKKSAFVGAADTTIECNSCVNNYCGNFSCWAKSACVTS